MTNNTFLSGRILTRLGEVTWEWKRIDTFICIVGSYHRHFYLYHVFLSSTDRKFPQSQPNVPTVTNWLLPSPKLYSFPRLRNRDNAFLSGSTVTPVVQGKLQSQTRSVTIVSFPWYYYSARSIPKTNVWMRVSLAFLVFSHDVKEHNQNASEEICKAAGPQSYVYICMYI